MYFILLGEAGDDSVSLLSMVLAVVLSNMVFIMLSYVPSVLVERVLSSVDVEFCQKLFFFKLLR